MIEKLGSNASNKNDKETVSFSFFFRNICVLIFFSYKIKREQMDNLFQRKLFNIKMKTDLDVENAQQSFVQAVKLFPIIWVSHVLKYL